MKITAQMEVKGNAGAVLLIIAYDNGHFGWKDSGGYGLTKDSFRELIEYLMETDRI